MKARALTRVVTAPVGGWNVRDSIAMMKETEAVQLDNWFPTTTDCVIRKGDTLQASGISGNVHALIVYNPPSGAKKLFAFTDSGNLYDATTAGAAVGAALITGLSNGKWQYIEYGTAAGQFILAVNGADPMLRYNGTNWISVLSTTTGATVSSLVGNGTTVTVTTSTPHKLQTGNTVTISGCATVGYNVGPVAITKTGANTFTYVNATVGAAGGTPAYTVSAGEVITGIDPATCFNINAFKQRVWLVPNNSLSAWYLSASAISGAATEFPMAAYYPEGGSLLSIATWTIDAGVGIDDNVCFMSTEGEILVYKGTDPSSSTTFALVGLFRMGNPIGARCQIKYLGDVYVITDSGVAPLSQAILTAQVTIKSDVTDKIQQAISTAVQSTRSSFGWQLLPYPAQNMLIVNVPGATSSSPNYQFVMNTITGSWCRFLGWNAFCWEAQGNNIYYGTAGNVYRAWSGTTDHGSAIVAEAIPAFNSFGNSSRIKKFNAARPILLTDGSPTLLGDVNVDFDTTAPTGSLSYAPPTSAMTWGSMTWGSMVWGGSYTVQKDWQYVGAVGYWGAFHFKVQNNGSNVNWESTDYLLEAGGIIG